jgi:FMN reductase
MTNPPAEPDRFSLVVISAGTSDPSSTRMLADRIAARVAVLAGERAEQVTVSVIDLRVIATEISTALVSQLVGPGLEQAIAALGRADGIVAATPVYNAGVSGLFASFLDVLDKDLIIAKPTVLAATAGTARHALVVDEQLRAQFAYLRALSVPTSVFAAPEDWSDVSLSQRIDRAALELLFLMESGFAQRVKDQSWHNYQHDYGSRAESEDSIDLDSDLMRLATGGTAG